MNWTKPSEGMKGARVAFEGELVVSSRPRLAPNMKATGRVVIFGRVIFRYTRPALQCKMGSAERP